MGKKGRKKAKALKKKSPEEEKAEIVAILMAKCGKEEKEVISETKVGISRNLKSWDFQDFKKLGFSGSFTPQSLVAGVEGLGHLS